MKLTFSSEECDGGTLSSSTTCATNAMNVIFRVVGVVIVEHMSDISNILKQKVSVSQMESLTRRRGPYVVV
jgi:hypothetical protein